MKTAHEIVGGLLVTGGTLDLIFAEIPRLLNPRAKDIKFNSTNADTPVMGLNLWQSGVVGALFDGIIIYGGMKLSENK